MSILVFLDNRDGMVYSTFNEFYRSGEEA